MGAKYLEGESLANQIRQQVMAEIGRLPSPPKLVSLLIGADKGAFSYAKIQKKACEEVGIRFDLQTFEEGVSESRLIQAIQQLNRDPGVTGIMIFVPVPKTIHVERLIEAIAPEKDVEGITPANMGKLFYGTSIVPPCSPQAVLMLLQNIGVALSGQEVVVISRNPIIGQPLLVMLLRSVHASPTPTCCHIATKDLASHTRKADIIVVAAGRPGLIRGDMIKRGAIVIDIGINLVEEEKNGHKIKRIVGDVDFDSAREVASWLTPVPGGVGVVTTSVLLQNIVTLAKLHFQSL